MTEKYNTALNELNEYYNNLKEKYDDDVSYYKAFVKKHTTELTDEIINKAKKTDLLFDIQQHGFSGFTMRTTKQTMIKYIKENNVNKHYDQELKNNIDFLIQDIEDDKKILNVTELVMKNHKLYITARTS